MTNSRRKGADYEREVARELRDYGYKVRRGQQFCGANGDADVVRMDGIHLECKRTERTDLYGWMAQAERDAREGELPVVFHRKNNCKTLAIMSMETFMRMYQDYEPPVPFADLEGEGNGES
ncbi:MAG: hypothetical protein IIU70_07260 [Anaerotignum sp.]|nr:hypothetical protein [Anaerotignum sp.]